MPKKTTECSRCEEKNPDDDHVCDDLKDVSPDARAIVLALDRVNEELYELRMAVEDAASGIERD